MKNPASLVRWDRFPLTSKYDPDWVVDNLMGPNALWLCESLCGSMALSPGMRVLDMGCGRAATSIFLAREFGVTVWANDLWIAAADNWKRVREAGLESRVFPIRAEAHALPYADGFFDAIVSIDSYHYYGTSDTYLKYFVRFVKPGGQIGIVVPGFVRELTTVPPWLTKPRGGSDAFFDPSECWSFHSAPWWRRHFERTGLVGIEEARLLKDGWRLWVRSEEARAAGGKMEYPSEAPAIRADRGRNIGFVQMVARRRQVGPNPG